MNARTTQVVQGVSRNTYTTMTARDFVRTAIRNGNFRNKSTSFFTTSGFQQQAGQAFARSGKTHMSMLRNIRARLFHTTRARRSTPNPTANLGSPANENLSLGQRMRKLSREYGWSALGVYLALSALDSPFCYLLVRFLGTDRIGKKTSTSSVVASLKRCANARLTNLI
jgi:hypothetical protein